MDLVKFAFCITFGEVSPSEIVSAANRHSVHVLNTEVFNPAKHASLLPQSNDDKGLPIFPLFLFPGNSILAEDDASREEARSQLQAFLK